MAENLIDKFKALDIKQKKVFLDNLSKKNEEKYQLLYKECLKIYQIELSNMPKQASSSVQRTQQPSNTKKENTTMSNKNVKTIDNASNKNIKTTLEERTKSNKFEYGIYFSYLMIYKYITETEITYDTLNIKTQGLKLGFLNKEILNETISLSDIVDLQVKRIYEKFQLIFGIVLILATLVAIVMSVGNIYLFVVGGLFIYGSRGYSIKIVTQNKTFEIKEDAAHRGSKKEIEDFLNSIYEVTDNLPRIEIK